MILRWQQLFVDFRLCSILLDWIKHICPKIFSKLTIWSLVLSDDKDRLVIRKQEINFWKIIKDSFEIWYNTTSSSTPTAYPPMIGFYIALFTLLLYKFDLSCIYMNTFFYIYLNIQSMNLLCTCCWDLYGSSVVPANAKKTSKFWLNLHRDINYPGYSKP